MLALALMALAALVLPAHAQAPRQGLCVSCSGPDAEYVCEVASEDGKVIAQQATQLYCITRLAKDGAHQSCVVRRDQQAACTGIEKRYSYDAAVLGPLLSPEPKTDPVANPPNENKTVAKKTEPKTVVEAGERAVDASKQGIKTLGSTVKDGADKTKNAAKSTWQCLTSLFKDC